MSVPSLLLLVLEWLAFAAVAFLLGEAALTVAERALGAARPPTSFVRIAGSLLAGLGIAPTVGVILGLLGIFGSASLIAVAAATLAIRGRVLVGTLGWLWERRPRRRPKLGAVAAALVAIPLAAAAFLAATAPPTDVDALAYHLPEARELVASGELRPTVRGDPFYGNLPKLGELLLAEGLALDGLELAQTLPLLVVFAFAALAAAFTARLVAPAAAVLAVVFVLLYDDYLWNATVSRVDAIAASFEVGALLAAVAFGAERERAHLALAALLVGLALSVKYTAGATAVAAVVLVTVLAWRTTRSPRAVGALLGRAALVAVAVGGYWYAKNVIRFGNPVYPLYFGHHGLDEATYRSVVESIQEFETRSVGGFVGLLGRFATPWTLSLFVPLAFAPLAFAVRRARLLAVTLVPYVVAYVAYWYFLASHLWRFLMPAILAALVLLAVTFGAASRLLRVGLVAGAAAVTLAAVGPSALAREANGLAHGKLRNVELRFVRGVESREDYLRRRLGCGYAAARHLEALGAGGDVVNNWMRWDGRWEFYAANEVRPLPVAAPQALASLVEREAFRWLYVRRAARAAAWAADDPYARRFVSLRMPLERQLERASRLVWRRDDCSLYEIRPRRRIARAP